MKLSIQQKADLIREFLSTKGFVQDRFGHMLLTTKTGTKYRYKFQKISIRKEVQGSVGWVRLSSLNINKVAENLDRAAAGHNS